MTVTWQLQYSVFLLNSVLLLKLKIVSMISDKKINKLFRYHVITNNICPPGTALGTLTAIRKPNPTWKGDPGPMKHYSFVFGGCLHLWNSTEWDPVFSGTTIASSDKNGHWSNGTFHGRPRGRPQVQLWGYEKGR